MILLGCARFCMISLDYTLCDMMLRDFYMVLPYGVYDSYAGIYDLNASPKLVYDPSRSSGAPAAAESAQRFRTGPLPQLPPIFYQGPFPKSPVGSRPEQNTKSQVCMIVFSVYLSLSPATATSTATQHHTATQPQPWDTELPRAWDPCKNAYVLSGLWPGTRVKMHTY